MEFTEKQKEFTHKNNKSFRCKYITKVVNSCTKCHGDCIFSKSFLEKYPKSTALRNKLDEKFYATEFEYIRSLVAEYKSKDEGKGNSEEEEDESMLKTFDLLKKFHSFKKADKDNMRKFHNASYYSFNPDTRTNKLIKIKTKRSDCPCPACSPNVVESTRQKKNSNLVCENICDFRIESEKEKQASSANILFEKHLF